MRYYVILAFCLVAACAGDAARQSQTPVGTEPRPTGAPWEDARRRGVDFRGTGNEPGWYLEIERGAQLTFVTDFGAQRFIVSDPVEAQVGAVRRYQGVAQTQQLRVEIVDQPCVDNMSGELFPSRVTVTLDNTAYQGCGQSLSSPGQGLDQPSQ